MNRIKNRRYTKKISCVLPPHKQSSAAPFVYDMLVRSVQKSYIDSSWSTSRVYCSRQGLIDGMRTCLKKRWISQSAFTNRVEQKKRAVAVIDGVQTELCRWAKKANSTVVGGEARVRSVFDMDSGLWGCCSPRQELRVTVVMWDTASCR